jgi:hypothetical protein
MNNRKHHQNTPAAPNKSLIRHYRRKVFSSFFARFAESQKTRGFSAESKKRHFFALATINHQLPDYQLCRPIPYPLAKHSPANNRLAVPVPLNRRTSTKNEVSNNAENPTLNSRGPSGEYDKLPAGPPIQPFPRICATRKVCSGGWSFQTWVYNFYPLSHITALLNSNPSSPPIFTAVRSGRDSSKHTNNTSNAARIPQLHCDPEPGIVARWLLPLAVEIRRFEFIGRLSCPPAGRARVGATAASELLQSHPNALISAILPGATTSVSRNRRVVPVRINGWLD